MSGVPHRRLAHGAGRVYHTSGTARVRESAITESLARRAASLVKSLIELQSGYQLTRDQGFESLRRANTALHECFSSVTLHYEEKALGLRWRNGDVSRLLYGSSLTGRAL